MIRRSADANRTKRPRTRQLALGRSAATAKACCVCGNIREPVHDADTTGAAETDASEASEEGVSLRRLGESLFKKALSFRGTPRKHWSVVQRLYRWVLRSGCDYYVAHYNLARNLQEHGKFEEAAEHYRKSLEIEPTYSPSYNNLGIVLAELGRYDESLHAFKQALKIEERATPHANMGDIYMRLNRLEEAESELLKALETMPDHLGAVFTYAQVLERMGRIDESKKKYRKALALAPEDAEIQRCFGELLVREGCCDEGEQHMRIAEELERAAEPKDSPLDQWQEQSGAYRQNNRRTRYYGLM